MGVEIVQIRAARPEDAAVLASVHDAAWRSTYQGIIPHIYLERMIAKRTPNWWRRTLERDSGYLILTFDGQPQGYASIGIARYARIRNAGEIFELYLNPPFQGIGFGKRLFHAARRELRLRGLNALVVWALEDNHMACDFYERLGGKPGAKAPQRYGETVLQKLAYSWPAAHPRRN